MVVFKARPRWNKKGGVEIPLTAQSDPQVGLLAVHAFPYLTEVGEKKG